MNKMSVLFGPMRLPFVILAPICVFLGIATASFAGAQFSVFQAVLAVSGGVFAHISVNAFNEYTDFKSGLDFNTTKTPFSGGSGTLPENPDGVEVVLFVAWFAMALTVAIGIYFIWLRGWLLLPLGLIGAVMVLGYSKWFTRNPFFCLISPGIGFGSIMVIGTHVALTGSYGLSAVAASFVPFFLVNDLLLLNQFPDVEADRGVGRRHYPILMGRKKSAWLYISFLLLAYLTLAAAVFLSILPLWSLLGLATAPLAFAAGRGALKYADNTQAIVPYLVLNVLINLLTPLLMAAGIFIAN
ncbi:MAG: prenyltransferase [Acidobacteria bacterium]|nr:prenyltransferase [Acidobacteriota bacterium]